MAINYFSKDFDSYPDKYKLLFNLVDLDKLNHNDLSDLEFEKIITSAIKTVPFHSLVISKGQLLFRARVSANGKPFTRTDELFAPPAKIINEYGRFNSPGESVLYCSTNIILAVAETIISNAINSIKDTDKFSVTVGVWKTNADLKLATVIHSKKINEIRQDYKERYTKYLTENLSHSPISHNQKVAGELINYFFAEQFSKKKSNSHLEYRSSAFYAKALKKTNALLTKNNHPVVNGILYPSVAQKYEGDNIVLFTETISDKLDLHDVVNTQAIKVSDDEFEVLMLNHLDKIENGKIFYQRMLFKV